MSKPNNAGMVSFDVCNINALYLEGQRFQNLDQAEMDLIIANLDNITQNATKIAALEAADVVIHTDISNIQTMDISQNTAISALQTSDISQNAIISNLQATDASFNNKLQYWDANGTIYNNTGGNGGITGVGASTAVVISGSDNTMVQFGGTNGISGGSNNGVRLRAQDTSDFHINCGNTSGTINIGMDTTGGYGTSKVNIGGGESVIRIGNAQDTLSLTTGPKIYIGQKHSAVADSDTYLAGNVQTDSAQFVDLHTTSLITWDNLLALYDVPFSISTMPYWMIWAISSVIPNYVYSDVVKMKRNALYEKYGEIDTSNRLDLESLNIFNTSIINPLNNVFTTFSLYGGCSMSTLSGTHRLYSLTGGVELRCDGGIVDWITTEDTHDTNRMFVGDTEVSMTASKSSTNVTIQSLHSGTAINFYNNNSVNGYSSTRKLTMKMTDTNDVIVRGTTSYNGHPFTIDASGISGEKGVAVKGATSSASTITTKNVASPSFTINEAYSGIVQNTLYRDANSNLYFNGKNISAPVASTANTYILTISGNSTTPPVSNGGLVTSYTSTTGYYIEKSAYSVNTEYEMATFKSSNIDLTTNPIIPDGVWDFNFYHSYNGNEQVNAYFKIYVEQTLIASPNTVTTTLLVDGSSSAVPLTINGTTGTYTILENQVFMPLYQFPDLVSYTYKIVVKQYFKQPTGNTNAHVVRFSYNNGSLSHLHTTLNTGGGITAIPTLQQVLTSGASANSIGITNLDSVSGSNNADVFYAATGSGQLSLNAAGSTKLRVGSSGITATSTLNMNGNNITGANEITGNNLTFKTGGVDRLKLTDAGIYFNNTLYHGLTYQMGFNRIIYDGQITRSTVSAQSPWTYNFFLASMPYAVDLTYYDIEYYLSVRRGGGGNLATSNYSCCYCINEDYNQNSYGFIANGNNSSGTYVQVSAPSYVGGSTLYYYFYYGNNTYWEAQVEGRIAMENRFPLSGTNKTFTHNINNTVNIYSSNVFSGSNLTYKITSQGLCHYISPSTTNFNSIAFFASCNSFIESDSMYLTVKQVQRRNI